MKLQGIVFVLVVSFCCESYASQRDFSKEFRACISKSVDIDAQYVCIKDEINIQKARLDDNYKKIAGKLAVQDKKYLDQVQRNWIVWRDGNYNFLSEHVGVAFATARVTSLNFLLNSVYDRADELKMILDELGD